MVTKPPAIDPIFLINAFRVVSSICYATSCIAALIGDYAFGAWMVGAGVWLRLYAFEKDVS